MSKSIPTTQDTIAALSADIDRLMERAWAIHTRLGQAYSSQYDQVQDMIALGQLAERVRDLRKARAILSDPTHCPEVRGGNGNG